jgi:hypothetical protein
MLPAVFTAVAPPGTENIPLVVGSIALAATVLAALSAFSARETYRVHMNDLGKPDAAPINKVDYDKARSVNVANSQSFKAFG